MPTDREKKHSVTVMAHRELAKQLRTIADHREITMAEALDRFAGPAIQREFRKVLDDMQNEFAKSE